MDVAPGFQSKAGFKVSNLWERSSSRGGRANVRIPPLERMSESSEPRLTSAASKVAAAEKFARCIALSLLSPIYPLGCVLTAILSSLHRAPQEGSRSHRLYSFLWMTRILTQQEIPDCVCVQQ